MFARSNLTIYGDCFVAANAPRNDMKLFIALIWAIVAQSFSCSLDIARQNTRS